MAKLLIVTQKVDVNDPILGFFHGWLEEFSKHYEKVMVICLEKGAYNLQSNVKVFSLGKEVRVSKLGYVFNFYHLIFNLRGEYDSVFVHMNYVYVLLGGLWWKMWHKKIALWYVHRQKSLGLWLSEKFVNTIFTSSPESFTIKSNKVLYIGHGVDSSKFANNELNQNRDKTKIVHVGRITQIKNLETLILAGEIMNKKINNLSIELYGGVSNDADRAYVEELKKLIKDKSIENVVVFKGLVSNEQISDVYASANLSVNMSPKGGWDKVVIESLMALCPVFVSNLALKPVLGEYWDKFIFERKNPLDLAYKIETFLALEDRDSIIKNLRNHAVKEYDLNNLIEKICGYINRN